MAHTAHPISQQRNCAQICCLPNIISTLSRVRERLHSHPTEGWSSNTHLKASAYIIANGSVHSVPVEHSNTRWSKPEGRGRSEVCQLASGATCLGAVARAKGIRCSRPSCVKGTAVLALNGELRGRAPGGGGRPPGGSTGTMFQVTVTKPWRPPATSAV